MMQRSVLAMLAAVAAVADAQNWYVRLAFTNTSAAGTGLIGASLVLPKTASNQPLCTADYIDDTLSSYSKITCNGTHFRADAYNASDSTCSGSTITPPTDPTSITVPTGVHLTVPYSGKSADGNLYRLTCFDAGSVILGKAKSIDWVNSSCSGTTKDQSDWSIGVCMTIDGRFGPSVFKSFDIVCNGANAFKQQLYSTSNCTGSFTVGDEANATCAFDDDDNVYTQISGTCSGSSGSLLDATEELPSAAATAAPTVWLAAALAAAVVATF